MPEITFYQADETIAKSLAPLLIKILEDKKRAMIFCSDQKQIAELDVALWTYGRHKFIPHAIVGDKEFEPARQPVLISGQEDNLNQANFLIFLQEPSDAFLSSFERVFYFFEERDFSEAKVLAKKMKPKNSYKKEEGKWVKFAL